MVLKPLQSAVSARGKPMFADSAEVKLRSKPRYRVNLAEQMACCEANYARLIMLMPEIDLQEEWQYQVESGGKAWSIRLRVVDRARYTTTLEITQEDQLRAWSGLSSIQVRMYHDARMAEVVAWQQHRGLKPRYEYPNCKMYHQDEKAQVNRFLSDWLIHSQANGRVLEVARL